MEKASAIVTDVINGELQVLGHQPSSRAGANEPANSPLTWSNNLLNTDVSLDDIAQSVQH